MFRKLLLSLLLFSATRCVLHAQAAPAAEKTGGLQAGVGYVHGHPDYSPANFNGFTVFGDVDLFKHFGIEAEFHRIAINTDVSISEKTYEVGGRYRYPIGRFSPYIKVLGGAGTFNFNTSPQNGTYTMYAGGGGVDFRVQRRITFRVDYEYQRWGSFPPRGLQPSIATIGAAYTFK